MEHQDRAMFNKTMIPILGEDLRSIRHCAALACAVFLLTTMHFNLCTFHVR